ncbi:MAG: hypothetical protein N4A45_10890 [Flavobacteriales bacterium]|nr:hypothetical protein [Flavobacteriales bacterium]
MPGRKYTSGDGYRFGFQGQEVDNEIKGEGNSVNYKFRMHDPRLGRFFAVDPLAPKYPHYTPYSFSGNKVIAHIELEGLEELKVTDEFGEIMCSEIELIKSDQVLNLSLMEIQDPERADKYVVHLAVQAKSRRGENGSTADFTSYGKLLSQWNKLSNNQKIRQGTRVANNVKIARKRIKNVGLSEEELISDVDGGRQVFVIGVTKKNMEKNGLKSNVGTVLHEIDAHLSNDLNGVGADQETEHREYFDLDNDPSGLSEQEIKSGYSPSLENINPNSQAGKTKTRINEAAEKL